MTIKLDFVDFGKHEELLGVTGNPIFHSKSPFIFNTIFQQQNLNNRYHYIKLAANTPGEAMFLFKELKLKGMNVTAPFKRSIMDYLDIIDPAAEKIDAVNTVTWEKMCIKGYNTDHTGVTQALKETGMGIKLEGKQCIVVGAGGAGRAAVYGLLKEKAMVTLVNRTYSKATQTANEFGCEAKEISSLQHLLKDADILVSTLPAGIDIIQEDWLHKELVVLDANYKQTLLCKMAKEKGCQVVRGEQWLLYQAIPAYQYFMGDLPKDFAVLEATKYALCEVLHSPVPKNIALVGFMGSGKSLIGERLAKKLGMDFKDLDVLIEKEAGCSIPDIFRLHGESTFRSMERFILKQEMQNNQGVVYACGGGIVLEEENRRVLEETSLVVWLYSSIATTLKRIQPGTSHTNHTRHTGHTRPLLDCPEPENTAEQLLNDRLFRYAQASNLVVSSENEPSQVVEKIINEIGKTVKN